MCSTLSEGSDSFYAPGCPSRTYLDGRQVACHAASEVAFEAVRLVGVAEIAEMLGVTRQRVHQIAAEPDFPEPVARLTAGLIWRRSDVHRWAVNNGRMPKED